MTVTLNGHYAVCVRKTHAYFFSPYRFVLHCQCSDRGMIFTEAECPYTHGCLPLVIRPSLLLLSVLGTICTNMSRPHPLRLFSEVASRLSSSGIPSRDFYRNFWRAFAVTQTFNSCFTHLHTFLTCVRAWRDVNAVLLQGRFSHATMFCFVENKILWRRGGSSYSQYVRDTAECNSLSYCLQAVAVGRPVGMILLSVCLSVCLRCCALWLNDTSYSKSVWITEWEVSALEHEITNGPWFSSEIFTLYKSLTDLLTVLIYLHLTYPTKAPPLEP